MVSSGIWYNCWHMKWHIVCNLINWDFGNQSPLPIFQIGNRKVMRNTYLGKIMTQKIFQKILLNLLQPIKIIGKYTFQTVRLHQENIMIIGPWYSITWILKKWITNKFLQIQQANKRLGKIWWADLVNENKNEYTTRALQKQSMGNITSANND